jgi:hypothetical protein
MKKDNKIIRILGFVILITSCTLFLLIPVVPFAGFSAGRAAAIATGLLIAGEITFYLSLFILGRSFWDKIRNWFKFRKAKNRESSHLQENK